MESLISESLFRPSVYSFPSPYRHGPGRGSTARPGPPSRFNSTPTRYDRRPGGPAAPRVPSLSVGRRVPCLRPPPEGAGRGPVNGGARANGMNYPSESRDRSAPLRNLLNPPRRAMKRYGHERPLKACGRFRIESEDLLKSARGCSLPKSPRRFPVRGRSRKRAAALPARTSGLAAAPRRNRSKPAGRWRRCYDGTQSRPKPVPSLRFRLADGVLKRGVLSFGLL